MENQVKIEPENIPKENWDMWVKDCWELIKDYYEKRGLEK